MNNAKLFDKCFYLESRLPDYSKEYHSMQTLKLTGIYANKLGKISFWGRIEDKRGFSEIYFVKGDSFLQFHYCLVAL